MSKTKTESKFKLKNYISYIMVIAVLGVSVILQLTGNLQRSASTLLVQIAYSIILAGLHVRRRISRRIHSHSAL